MYPAVLNLHSWLRWVVVIAGILVVWRAFAKPGTSPWTSADDGAAKVLSIALDVQFILGLLLYLKLSPVVDAAMVHVSESMRHPQIRFWLVEHPVGMLAAIALVHMGQSLVRKAPAQRKRAKARLFYGLGVLVMLASIPWPGLPYGRALIRW